MRLQEGADDGGWREATLFFTGALKPQPAELRQSFLTWRHPSAVRTTFAPSITPLVQDCATQKDP